MKTSQPMVHFDTTATPASDKLIEELQLAAVA
jgi:hypothetical protein